MILPFPTLRRTILGVGILQDFADRLGIRPVTGGIAQVVATSSPFADNSHLADVTLADLYGFAPYLRIDRARAMKLSVIAKGRRAVATTVGRLPLEAVDSAGVPVPKQPSLLRQPERARTRSNTLTWTVDALMFYPCTEWIVRERDAYGWPSFVEWVPWDQARRDADGNLVAAFGVDVAPADVIRFDAPDAGLLADADETIRRAILIQKAASHAESNPVPSIDLHNDGEDLDEKEIDSLIDRWITARSRHGVGYSSKALKVNALGQNVEQLLIDGRKQLDLELVRHMGVPAWVADVAVEGSSLNYSNRASRNWELLDLACAPYMTAIQDRLSLGDVTPITQTVRFRTDDLTRDDMTTRFNAYKVGKDGDFITNDQIAAWEGWPTTTERNAQ